MAVANCRWLTSLPTRYPTRNAQLRISASIDLSKLATSCQHPIPLDAAPANIIGIATNELEGRGTLSPAIYTYELISCEETDTYSLL